MIFPVIFLCFVSASFGCWPVDVHYQTTYCISPVAAIVTISREKVSSERFVAELEYEGTLVEAVKIHHGRQEILNGFPQKAFIKAAVVRIDSEKPSSSDVFATKLEYEGTLIDALKGITSPSGTKVVVSMPRLSKSCEPSALIVGEKYMILGDMEPSMKIKPKFVNGVKIITDDEAERKLKERIESYDCKCKVKKVGRFLPLPERPLETERPFECKVRPTPRCHWEEGACVLHVDGSRCRYISSCPLTDWDVL